MSVIIEFTTSQCKYMAIIEVGYQHRLSPGIPTDETHRHLYHLYEKEVLQSFGVH